MTGGQKKRVNIAMELVAKPSILFLDEPTSGLDATSSLSLIKALRATAKQGITVAAVLHQPRCLTPRNKSLYRRILTMIYLAVILPTV